jgi:hypothetical protein
MMMMFDDGTCPRMFVVDPDQSGLEMEEWMDNNDDVK